MGHNTRARNSPYELVAVGSGFVALAIAAFCLQVCYFFLTAEHVGFYTAVLKMAGKSIVTVLLPLLAGGILGAAAGGMMLWCLGRRPGLRKPIRWIGSVLAGVWLLLGLNFVGVVHLLPTGLLPQPPGQWVSADQIGLTALLRVYLRTFAFRGPAPVEQWLPWLAAIVAFLFLAFFLTRARASDTAGVGSTPGAQT